MEYYQLMFFTAVLSFAGVFNFLLALDERNEGKTFPACLYLGVGTFALTFAFHINNLYGGG